MMYTFEKFLKYFALLSSISSMLIANARAQSNIEISLDEIDKSRNVQLQAIKAECPVSEICPEHHAVIFVHGVFGGKETFGDWPKQVAQQMRSEKLDVYVLEYRTEMIRWLKDDVSTLDSIAEHVFDRLMPLIRPEGNSRYKSVNFIAHSLGGNVVSAYLHTVKSLLGHEIRARHGFVITLGTPVLGAQIADFAVFLKMALGMPNDPLLESLKRDNNFLRMMRYWRILENTKAANFGCPRLNLYVGVENQPIWSFVTVVPEESAFSMQSIAEEIKQFSGFTHSDLANSSFDRPQVRQWVQEKMSYELNRLANRDVMGTLCSQVR